MSEPLLSIVTITYNHEPYIAKTIEGVLMQKVDFPMEYIIAEDHSTDGTLSICRQYAEKYPDFIRLIYSDSNVGAIANERRAMKAARGKYIAFCEGDDYWTDSLKLQKQVDFLESHPEYSVTFHRYRNYNVSSGKYGDDRCGFLFEDGADSVDVDKDMYFEHWVTQPLTMVYRASCIDLDDMLKYKHYRDMHQIYHLLLNGKCRLFAFDGGIRQVHQGGMASTIGCTEYNKISIAIDEEFYHFNRSEPWAKKNYIDSLQACVRMYKSSDRKLAFKYILDRFKVDRSLRHLFGNLMFYWGIGR